MPLDTLLKSRITVNALKSRDSAGAFAEIAEAIVQAGLAPPDAASGMCAAFLAREKRGPTGLGFGLAVPHMFFDALTEPHLVVARSETGVDFSAVDALPVRTMFCIIAPESARERYLQVLGAVARVARDAQWRRMLERSATAAQALELLLRGDQALSH